MNKIKEAYGDYSYDTLPVTIDIKGICEIIENELKQSGYEMNYKIDNRYGQGYIYDMRIEKKEYDTDDTYHWIKCDLNIVPQYDINEPCIKVECDYTYVDSDRSSNESDNLYSMNDVMDYITNECLSD